MDPAFYIEVLQNVGLPIVTAVGGWYVSIWRSKQKKERDVLDNVSQILELQKNYIAEQDQENRKTRENNARLEAKLDGKRASIRKANYCKYTNEGEGCPVLRSEETQDERCETCKFNQNANSES